VQKTFAREEFAVPIHSPLCNGVVRFCSQVGSAVTSSSMKARTSPRAFWIPALRACDLPGVRTGNGTVPGRVGSSLRPPREATMVVGETSCRVSHGAQRFHVEFPILMLGRNPSDPISGVTVP
jgi:hypothetical protein